MRLAFKRRQESDLYTQEKGAKKYPPEVVKAFFEVMSIIAAAHDERDLRASRSLHFEKIKGGTQGERSLRLKHQYRLIVTIEEGKQGKCLLVHRIDAKHYQ